MPIYEYRCRACGHTFDKFVRSMSANTEVECPECHSDDCQKNISLFGMSGSSGTSVSAASCAPSG